MRVNSEAYTGVEGDVRLADRGDVALADGGDVRRADGEDVRLFFGWGVGFEGRGH